VYVPAHKPVTVGVVCPPGIHKNVYGAIPPLGFAVADPSQFPKHVAATVVTPALIGCGCVIFMATVVSQPLASVTVMLYVPAQSPEIFGVVCPVGAQL